MVESEYVYLVAPGVVVMKGVPESTPEAIDALFEVAASKVAGVDAPVLIAHLDEAGVPHAAARDRIKTHIDETGYASIGLVFQDNLMVRIATKFIIASLRVDNATVFDSLPEAIEFFTNRPPKASSDG